MERSSECLPKNESRGLYRDPGVFGVIGPVKVCTDLAYGWVGRAIDAGAFSLKILGVDRRVGN